MAGNEDWRWQQAQALQAASPRAGGAGPARTARPAASAPAAAPPMAPAAGIARPRDPLFAAWLTPWVLGLATGLALAAMAMISWSLLGRADRADPAVVAASVPPTARPAQPAPPLPAPADTEAVTLPPVERAVVAPVPAPILAPPAPRIATAKTASGRPPRTVTRRPAVTVAVRPGVARPSFDCRRAVGEVNRMICADSSLAQLDRALAARYRQVVAAMPGEEWRLDEAQADFLNARQRCASPACVERVMLRRADDLDSE